ncbi:MAG: hypothetical protein EOM67_12235 [Spirochaetia bacterium]|nr:hypothetical protein [Spirochaetia bacterium]
MSSYLLLMVLIISCSTSKKVATNKIEVDKSIIEQEALKQEENASNSVLVVDSSQVDKDVIAEFEINRTTVICPDSTTIKETIKGKVKSQSKEKKAVSEVKRNSLSNVIQASNQKTKIDIKKEEDIKETKKINSTRAWWYLGLGAVIAVLLWFNKEKISKWLVRLIRGK